MDSNNNANSAVRRFNITVDPRDICEKGIEIVKLIKKQWSDKQIAVKVFTDGLTNRLIACYLPENGQEMLLVRVYGEKTEIIIDREAELKNMIALHQCSFGPPIYCVFNNGLVYGFEKGDVLNKHLVSRTEIALKIAEKMAKMHTLKIGDGQQHEPCLFPLLRKFLDQLFERTLIDRKMDHQTLITKQLLTDEVDYIQEAIKDSDSPVVFCHNDLLPANILYDSELQEIKFIDYEYAGYNYQAFDIADHFSEYTGIVDFDASLLPTDDHQMLWLHHYLKCYRLFTNNDSCVQHSDVVKLNNEVNKFAACTHLLWSIWSLVMHQHSSHEFDYFSFAAQRIELYFRYKTNFLMTKI